MWKCDNCPKTKYKDKSSSIPDMDVICKADINQINLETKVDEKKKSFKSTIV